MASLPNICYPVSIRINVSESADDMLELPLKKRSGIIKRGGKAFRVSNDEISAARKTRDDDDDELEEESQHFVT